jgi:hypothetical protein
VIRGMRKIEYLIWHGDETKVKSLVKMLVDLAYASA